jgi:CO/xanthine dehydrogenase Mo-binding subunit
MEREKFRLTRGDKEFEQAIQTGQLENQRIQAEAAKTSAGKLSGTAQLLKDLGLAPTIENIERLSRAQYAARGDAALDRNEIARQRLLNEDMVYAGARMAYVNATDPVKKAEALRKMKEIERLNGIVDDGAMSSAAPVGSATLPPGFKLDK